MSEEECNKSIYSMEKEGGSYKEKGIEELCQYVQYLESDKRELLQEKEIVMEKYHQNEERIQDLNQQLIQLQSILEQTNDTIQTLKQENIQIKKQLTIERDRTAALVSLVDTTEEKYEQTERVRKDLVYKLSTLQAQVAEQTTQQLVSLQDVKPTVSSLVVYSSKGTISSDRFMREEQYKREIELLRQARELQEERAMERQANAVTTALKNLQTSHDTLIYELQTNHENRLRQWRYEEMKRSREIENAMAEDRYSIRLEMKYALQRIEIDQKVYQLQSQANRNKIQALNQIGAESPEDECKFSTGTLNEVVVRMQMEILRMKRFHSLKCILRIRQTKFTYALNGSLCRWKIYVSQIKMLHWNALVHIKNTFQHYEKRQKRQRFQLWKENIQIIKLNSFQRKMLMRFNQILAVERMSYVLARKQTRQKAMYFTKWTAFCTLSCIHNTLGTENSNEVSREVIVPLEQEIQKLHEQLATSKSEAWRYKRQLLKQFI